MSNINNEVWFYEKLNQFNNRFKKNILEEEHIIVGDEIDIGKKDKTTDTKINIFVQKAQKDGKNYLVPSAAYEQKDKMPIKIAKENTTKISVKNKAYLLVKNPIKSVKILPKKTMSYYEMITSWNNFKHKERKRTILNLIINDVAYSDRINVSILTYPEWLKDSPNVTDERLLGNCASINKPSGAKLKRFIKPNTKKVIINELNKIGREESAGIKQFIEDVSDFKPMWENPTRSTNGTLERCSLDNLSVLVFYNFPKQYTKTGKPIKYYKQKQELIEFHSELGHEKIERRIFPLLFKGGEYKWVKINNEKIYKVVGAIEEDFSKDIKPLSDNEFEYLKTWTKNRLYYSKKENRLNELKNKNFIIKHSEKISGNTWKKNYIRICNGLKLFCNSQEMFNEWEFLLYQCHIDYLDYIRDFSEKLEKEEREMNKDN
jgi:hypothetical protein